jgi:hypothetical protein
MTYQAGMGVDNGDSVIVGILLMDEMVTSLSFKFSYYWGYKVCSLLYGHYYSLDRSKNKLKLGVVYEKHIGNVQVYVYDSGLVLVVYDGDSWVLVF